MGEVTSGASVLKAFDIPSDKAAVFYNDAVVWVSGATGSWGKEFCRQLLLQPIKRLVAFCRGEHRGYDLATWLSDSRVQVFLGDIRDPFAVSYSLREADLAFHCAALKRIDAATFAPTEMCRVNIDGALNVIRACTENMVLKAFYISSDKAVMPTTFYGATKLVAEQLWLAERPGTDTIFTAGRFGNALGSTGSVLRIWEELRAKGEPLIIYWPNATRYVIVLRDTIDEIIQIVMPQASSGDLWIPKMKATTLLDLAKTFAGDNYPLKILKRTRGFGEKEHENLSADSKYMSSDCADRMSREELVEAIEASGFEVSDRMQGAVLLWRSI